MSRPIPRLPVRHPEHPAAVAPVPVDLSGQVGPTPNQARGPRWRAVGHGLHVPASVDPDLPVQRIVEAAAALPEYGGVTGWAALHWMGARYFDGRDRRGLALPVPLAIGGAADMRPDTLRAPSKERLAPFDLGLADNLQVTRAVRAVCFEMRYADDWRAAVVHADMAAHANLVSLEEARRYVTGYLSGWTGVIQLRRALEHADENSWSPREPHMRLIWTENAGLPRPLCNRPVFDLNGRHLGTPDLIDPVRGVAGEYDGPLHLDGARRHKDLGREDRFRSAGLEVVTMVAADDRALAEFIGRLHAAYARAARVPVSQRAYTLQLGPGWFPTHTVEQRRALRRAAAGVA